MSEFLVSTGGVSAALLIVLLAASVASRRYRFWPTPARGSYQSITFWTLFRTLNAAAIAHAVSLAPTLVTAGSVLGLPPPVRIAALATLAIVLAVYLSALNSLGEHNTYCGRNGLNTHGLYRWSRNPQYVSIMPVYAAMALAADEAATYALSAALIAVYWLMALAEEPWLEAGYGASYASYRRAVPRFFNWRRARALAVAGWRLATGGRLPALAHRA